MNINLFYQGTLELTLSLISTLVVFILSFSAFNYIFKGIDEVKELKKNNAALAILISSFIIGIMLLVKEATAPALDTFENLLDFKLFTFKIISLSLIRILLFYLISAFISFFLLLYSIRLFMYMTKDIDEIKEIKNNNISVSIVIASFILSISLIFINPLTTFLNAFVSSPNVNANLIDPLINFKTALKGFLEIFMSFFASIFIFFYGFKAFNFLTKNIDEITEIKNNNISVSLLISTFILSMMILIKAAIKPANEIINFINLNNLILKNILYSLSSILIIFISSAVISFAVLWITLKCFMLFTTKINELKEIKNKNIALAIILCALLISSAIIIEHSISTIFSSLINSPEVKKGILDLTNFR